MSAPVSLVAAVQEFKEARQIDAKEAIRISTELLTETSGFLIWLRSRTYAEIVSNGGVYYGEVDPTLTHEIAALNADKRGMEAQIATLGREMDNQQAEKRRIVADLAAANGVINELNKSKTQDKERTGIQIHNQVTKITELENEIARLCRAGHAACAKEEALKANLARFDQHILSQQSLINRMDSENGQTKARNATLAQENARLVAENTRLLQDNRDLTNRLAARRLRQGGGQPAQQTILGRVVFGITPPFIMSACGAVAPAGAYVSDVTGFTRLLKRKRRDGEGD